MEQIIKPPYLYYNFDVSIYLSIYLLNDTSYITPKTRYHQDSLRCRCNIKVAMIVRCLSWRIIGYNDTYIAMENVSVNQFVLIVFGEVVTLPTTELRLRLCELIL